MARKPAIAVFAFNRPEHLNRMLRSLSLNPGLDEHEIWFFIDGPRNSAEKKLTDEVQAIAQSWGHGLSKVLVSQVANRGLATSVRGGIDQVFASHDSVIVLEDDLVLSPDFLPFMTLALGRYKRTPKVATIQGYSYPLDLTFDAAYFLRGAGSWGWATWKDRWLQVEWDASKTWAELVSQKKVESLDFDGTYFYSKMLRQQIAGEIDSWAIPFYCDCFLKDKLSLFPQRSLVMNGGMDGSGTHEGGHLAREYSISLDFLAEISWPDNVDESAEARVAMKAFFKNTFGLKARVQRALKRLTHRVLYRKLA